MSNEEFDLIVHHETAKAWLVSETGKKDEAFWLPKSQCEIIDKKKHKDGMELITFEIPEWLAIEKDLL